LFVFVKQFTQMSFTPRKTYLALAAVWLIAVAYESVTPATTDIIEGLCMPMQVWPSWLASRIVAMAVFLPVEYLGPVLVMAFCYGRIYSNLKNKARRFFLCLPCRLKADYSDKRDMHSQKSRSSSPAQIVVKRIRLSIKCLSVKSYCENG
jgi:hypothetical protein